MNREELGELRTNEFLLNVRNHLAQLSKCIGNPANSNQLNVTIADLVDSAVALEDPRLLRLCKVLRRQIGELHSDCSANVWRFQSIEGMMSGPWHLPQTLSARPRSIFGATAM